MRSKMYIAVAGLILLLSAIPNVASASVSSCIDGSPVVPVDDQLWGALEPSDKNGLPNQRDSSDYTGQQLPSTVAPGASGGGGFPLFSSIDVENGYIFTGYTFGVMIWDARGANADDPQQLAVLEGARGVYPSWPGFSEVREFVWGVDAPQGDDTILAMVAREPVGVVLIDTTVKASPRVLYQDVSPYGLQVHAANIGGRDYAFVAASYNSARGIRLYDMTAASSLNGCLEASLVATECSGVYKGLVGPSARIGYITGFRAPNGKYYIAATNTLGRDLYIYDVSNPLNPVSLRTGGGPFKVSDLPFGVAGWAQGGKSFLGMQTTSGGVIYDLSDCIAGGGCPSLGASAWSHNWSVSADRYLVSYSESDGTPFLYFGSSNKCSGGLQREWLYDVSGLTSGGSPVDITPGTTMDVYDEGTDSQVEVDYWSWYYARNPSGFSQVMPREGKFWGSHFYRVGWTLFDVHQRVNVSPSIDVTGPSSAYTETSTNFIAQAFNCTPTPGGWNWTASGGGTTSSTSASANIEWTTLGTKTVSATNSGCPGATVEVASIQIANANPEIGQITVSPSAPYVCQPVTFDATASGKPPLTHNWNVNGNSGSVASGSGNPFVWDTSGETAGQYTAELELIGQGTDTLTSPTVTLQALPSLPAADQFAPTTDPFTDASVAFHLDVPGATEWNWDFGVGFAGWTSDPSDGPNPQYVYSQADVDAACNGALPCSFQVTVKIRNCVEGERTSATLEVIIEELTPLVASFSAVCPFGLCSFPAGQAVAFEDTSTGAEIWDYDWDGDGTFEDSGNTSPQTSHVYTSAGSYTPRLQVRRDGLTSDPDVAQSLVITAASPPAVVVNGPTSGKVGSSLTFIASATNCSPTTGGWTWTASGLNVSSTSASVSLNFPTPGFKQVRATNSACGSASGQRNVNITSSDTGGGGGGGGGAGGGGGGSFVPRITYTPQSPLVGQPVTFDGSDTQGAPSTYFWSFGDNGTAYSEVAQHTYQEPGTYTVKLTVGAANCLSPNCQKTVQQTITVGGAGNGGGGGDDVGANGCTGDTADDPTKLCLQGGRFMVSVNFDDPTLGARDAKSIGQSDRTGFFWFFRPDNVELILKVLDGGPVNGNWWFFYGGLSNVGYEITVTDTATTPMRTKKYVNEPGTICGVPDQDAFDQLDEPTSISGSGVFAFPAEPFDDGASYVASEVGIGTGSSDQLLLLDSRFRVTVDWRDQRTGATGVGKPIPGTDRTGFFYFFKESNIELVVKMIDARVDFEHFWVLWGGLTDVEYTLRVEDTITGETWTRTKPAGEYCGGADTTAFKG